MEATLDTRTLHLIFNSLPMGVFTIDGMGVITAFNQAAERITGYRCEEAVGRRCDEIFQANICQQDCPLKQSVSGRPPGTAREVRILAKDGRERLIEVTTAALVDDRGDIVGGVEMFRDLAQLISLRKQIENTYVFEDIVSKNAGMRLILERLTLFAQSASTVLIEGASGTGKELVARALHNLGPRVKKPFIAVNCAALPENLLESELFGYAKGAFTDAKASKPGRFALADGGSIFLDEIGDLSPAMQVKLLRVLQEREFEPLGAVESVHVDVRVIAATNCNLAEAVKNRQFREDLYYRLNVVRIALPPLAERRDDIPLLVQHFIDRFNARFGRRIKRATEEALAVLLNAPFPGNIRELENAIEHAFVVCDGDEIGLRHLPPNLQGRPSALSKLIAERETSPLAEAEADAIRRAVAQGATRAEVAQRLGLSRATLWRKMKKYKLF